MIHPVGWPIQKVTRRLVCLGGRTERNTRAESGEARLLLPLLSRGLPGPRRH